MIDLEQIKNVDTIKGVFFGVCHENANTAAKTVFAPGYTPSEGPLLVVRFEEGVDPVLNNTLNVNGSGALYLETNCLDYDQEGNPLYSFIQAGTYAVFTYYYIASDDQGYRLLLSNYTAIEMLYYLYQLILNKQDELVGEGVGQNIRKVLSNSLPGGGNIDIVGVCDSAEYADALVAAVDGFVLRDNAIAHIRFVHGIKTTVNSVYPKTLDINGTGPKSLMVWGSPNDFSYAGSWLVGDYIVASVVYLEGSQNYSEGYYIFGTSLDLYRMRWLYNNKQGNLPSFVGNSGKVLAVNDNATGLVWKSVDQTIHTTTVTTSAVTLTCAAGERAYHLVNLFSAPSQITITVNLLNNRDNTLILQGSTDVGLDIQINGQSANVVYEQTSRLGEYNGVLMAWLSKTASGMMKIILHNVDGVVVADVDIMEGYTPQANQI